MRGIQRARCVRVGDAGLGFLCMERIAWEGGERAASTRGLQSVHAAPQSLVTSPSDSAVYLASQVSVEETPATMSATTSMRSGVMVVGCFVGCALRRIGGIQYMCG